MAEPLVADASASPTETPKVIFIPALGSLGDVLPYYSLAKRLRKMGYRVKMGTHLRYKDVVDEKGTKYLRLDFGSPTAAAPLFRFLRFWAVFQPNLPFNVSYWRFSVRSNFYSAQFVAAVAA